MAPPLDRRSFLAAAGAGFLASLSRPAYAALDRSETIFASACRRRNGTYGVVLLNEKGELLSAIPLPGRGHDVVLDPVSGAAVVFARRPGNFAVVFDTARHEEPMTFDAPTGRHFYGHGAFSADGKLLFATENDYDAALGVIGIYDATAGFRRIGELESFGVGPHEMLIMPNGHTLVVCNGGIETHPDYGRAKLNLNEMRPSLAFIDSRDGSLIERHVLPVHLHQLSIRHMAVRPDGLVLFAGQHEGPETERPPLFGQVKMGHDVELFDLPEDERSLFRNYIGSVALSKDGERLALSSPRGNIVAISSAKTGRILARWSLRDGCGVAFDQHALFASSGEGAFGQAGSARDHDISFDNHLAVRTV